MEALGTFGNFIYILGYTIHIVSEEDEFEEDEYPALNSSKVVIFMMCIKVYIGHSC